MKRRMLEMRARADERWARTDERRAKAHRLWAKSEERYANAHKCAAEGQSAGAAKAEEGATKTDKGIDAMVKTMREEIATARRVQMEQGEKINILIDMQIEFRQDLKELAASQKLTDRKLQAYFDSLRKGRNGH